MSENKTFKLPRNARGERPSFFDDPAIDKLISMIFSLANELSTIYERQDTLERLLEKENLLSRASIEEYSAVGTVRADRDERINMLLSSMLRVLEKDNNQSAEQRRASKNMGYDEVIALVEK